MRKSRVAAALGAILATGLVVLWVRGPEGGEQAAAPGPPMVLAASVVVQDHVPSSTYNGRLTAVETVELKPPAPGSTADHSVPADGYSAVQGKSVVVSVHNECSRSLTKTK